MSLNKKKGPAPPPGAAARSWGRGCRRALGTPGTAEQTPPAARASAGPLPGAGVRAPGMDAPGDPEGPSPPEGDGEQRLGGSGLVSFTAISLVCC